jgi:hypothetical protein
MSYLEEDLKVALRREAAPPDFAERVLARLDQPVAPEPSWWEMLAVLLRPPRVQWVALSVIFSVMIPASVQYRKQQRMRAEGERAKEELVFAVRVAGDKLHKVQQRVLEIGRMDTRL